MHLAPDMQLGNGLLGGFLVGSSATLFLYLSGKITGISGITENVVKVTDGEEWSLSYLAGLGTAGYLFRLYSPEVFGTSTTLSIPAVVVAGVLTGFGTRLSGGCTSGHGICGLSRRSPRSLTAVLSFMATGAATTYVTHMPSVASILNDSTSKLISTDNLLVYVAPTLAVLGGSYLYAHARKAAGHKKEANLSKVASVELHLSSFVSALLFGLGLGISGMANPDKVLNFLNFTGAHGWDPTLAGVMGGGLLVTGIAFPLLHLNEVKTCTHLKFDSHPDNMKIDWKLLIGSALFGVGWGLGGACPGPALVSFGAGVSSAALFLPSLVAGILLKDILIK